MKQFLLQERINTHRKKLLSFKLPVVLGIDEKNMLRLADLVDLQHILMGGGTGSGKSVFEHTVIATLLQLLPKSKVQFFLVDMKLVDLIVYKDLPNLINDVSIWGKEVFSNLEILIEEKERRLKEDNQDYPYIVVIIDTISDLMLHPGSKYEDIVGRLMTGAVKAKIHVIMSDSRLYEGIFTPTLRKHFPTRICFYTYGVGDGVVILESKKYRTHELEGNGDMLILQPNMREPVHMQAPYITDDEIDKISGLQKSL